MKLLFRTHARKDKTRWFHMTGARIDNVIDREKMNTQAGRRPANPTGCRRELSVNVDSDAVHPNQVMIIP